MKKILLIGAITLFSIVAKAEDQYQISLGTGTAYSYGENVEIELDGNQDIDLGVVDFETKPDQMPPYYNIRISRWNSDSDKKRAIEFELIHQKLYADKDDLGQGISDLKITDGYNLLYGNMAVMVKPQYIARFGAGLVVSHPSISINQDQYHGSYQISGVTAQLGIEREFPIDKQFIFSLEGKVTYSYADLRFDGGSVEIPNTAFHLIAQLKYSL